MLCALAAENTLDRVPRQQASPSPLRFTSTSSFLSVCLSSVIRLSAEGPAVCRITTCSVGAQVDERTRRVVTDAAATFIHLSTDIRTSEGKLVSSIYFSENQSVTMGIQLSGIIKTTFKINSFFLNGYLSVEHQCCYSRAS